MKVAVTVAVAPVVFHEFCKLTKLAKQLLYIILFVVQSLCLPLGEIVYRA